MVRASADTCVLPSLVLYISTKGRRPAVLPPSVSTFPAVRMRTKESMPHGGRTREVVGNNGKEFPQPQTHSPFRHSAQPGRVGRTVAWAPGWIPETVGTLTFEELIVLLPPLLSWSKSWANWGRLLDLCHPYFLIFSNKGPNYYKALLKN